MPCVPPTARRDIDALDRELARLGRGAGALRLRLGEALERLAVQGGHHACGFSSLAAYARERCERSGRWAIESRTVARRLLGLPRLRAALRKGELSWSMVELLSRYASAEDEEELVTRARRCTVRQMREALKAADTDAEPEVPMRTLTVTVPTEDAWAFECTRLLIEKLEGGKASLDTVLTAMLAEGEITLQGMVAAADRDGAERSEGAAKRAAAWLQELARYREEAELRCEPRIPRVGAREADEVKDAPELEGDPVALDARIRSLARELLERELALGRAAVRLFHANGWRRLGYASAAQYARERVGLSYSALKSHMTLARRAMREPVVREAVCAGRIGREAALLVARVGTPRTIDAWVARAQERTIKHLHEEVKAVELIGRLMQRGDLEPPDDETMGEVAALETAVLSGRVYRDGFRHAAIASQMSALEQAVESAGQASQMSAQEEQDGARPRRGAGRITLRLRVSAETYREYRALEQDYVRRSGCPLEFMGFLCLAVWHSWHASLGKEVAYAGIYARDRYRCSSPVCTRCDVTPHHLRFRSQGGDDTAENLSSLCVWCHLEGIHGGRIRALPPASNTRWLLGERPILVVQGRRKREIRHAA